MHQRVHPKYQQQQAEFLPTNQTEMPFQAIMTRSSLMEPLNRDASCDAVTLQSSNCCVRVKLGMAADVLMTGGMGARCLKLPLCTSEGSAPWEDVFDSKAKFNVHK